jgi:hypothetical protein
MRPPMDSEILPCLSDFGPLRHVQLSDSRHPTAARSGRDLGAAEELARQRHGAVARPLPAPVELGLRFHCARTPAPGAAPGGQELLSIFGAHWATAGFLASPSPRDPRQGYFPGPSFGCSDDVDGHPPIDTSGIIQPPLHAVAAGSTLLHGHLASDFVFGDFCGDALVGVCGIGFRSILMRHRSQIGQPLASAQV